MRLLLSQPVVAQLPCRECIQFIYDPSKGWEASTTGAGVKRKRPSKVPPPCRQCPKESPERAWLYELSRKNRMAVRHYYECRAMGFVGMTDQEKADPIVRRNFAIIDAEIREYERQRQGQDAMLLMQTAMSETVRGFTHEHGRRRR